LHAAPKAALIVACYKLLEASMERLSQERQQLCLGLAAAAASAPTAQCSGDGGGSAAASGAASSAGGGALPDSTRDAARGSSHAKRAAEAQVGAAAGPGADAAMAAAAAGPGGDAAPAGAGDGLGRTGGALDALAEQSELAELIAANTARMGGLLQLHHTTAYAILTDVQRARLDFLSFPILANVAKCIAAIAHMLKFEPVALAPAAELRLRWEMARWAGWAPGPPPPQGCAAGAGTAVAGARDAGAAGGDCASSGAVAAECPAAASPAPHPHARGGPAT
jgi:hypothetical protein